MNQEIRVSTGPQIAIVGMGIHFPGADRTETYWGNILRCVDSSSEVSAARWCLPPPIAADESAQLTDRVRSTRGYFLDVSHGDVPADLHPCKLGLPWSDFDPSIRMVLRAGRTAFLEAAMAAVDPKRVGVILGNIVLPTEHVSQLACQLLPTPWAGQLTKPQRALSPWNRYVSGLPAAMLAQALGLGGVAFTLDAACASSLYALKLAIDLLQSGRADAMLAGGMSRPDSLYTQMGFSQLQALSPTGRCRPFAADGDGLLVGEGAGVFVLKRLEDAQAHGDRLLGVIAGVGLANDIAGNLLAPASEGQLRALRQAYRRAGWSPADVDLIECHATGTPMGDATEFASLMALWQGQAYRPGQCVIGSVKSTVGHLLTGAGAAGLAKVLLALQHQQLPPMANFTQSGAQIPLHGSPFRILQTAEPWMARSQGEPRRAAVSAFGFGGINAHVLIEEPQFSTRTQQTVPAGVPRSKQPVAIVGMAATVGPWQDLHEYGQLVLGLRPLPESMCPPGPSVPADSIQGYFLNQICVGLNRFRIPPREMEEMLPQQLLMLVVAADALADAQGAQVSEEAEHTGVFIGLGLDLNTTNFHLRWSTLAAHAETDPDWADQAAAAVSPPLTANRTMGALGSIAASRIARAFHFGGPSFTLSSEDLSSAHALQTAVRALQQGEIARAVVGGVEFTGDPRTRVATQAATGQSLLADGAGAVVLKRLSDAEAAGDRIYALIQDVGDSVESVSEHNRLHECLPPPMLLHGDVGAANSILTLIQAALAIHTQTLPPKQGIGARFWLQNDPEVPRRILIEERGITDQEVKISIQEYHSRLACVSSVNLAPRPEGLFIVPASTPREIQARLDKLKVLVERDANTPIHELAGRWWKQTTNDGMVSVALVARTTEELLAQIAFARKHLRDAPTTPLCTSDDRHDDRLFDRVFYTPKPLAPSGQVAFVYPGSGNHYPGMGRAWGVDWPGILREQQQQNKQLKQQYAVDSIWVNAFTTPPSPQTLLFAQVALGTLISDTLRSFAVEPHAVLGYSLGESAGLFGMRVWQDRDQMYQRILESPIFVRELAPPFEAARQAWGLTAETMIDWVTGIVQASPEAIKQALRPDKRVYLLIINSPNECVIGGLRDDLEAFCRRLAITWLPIEGVTLAHCPATIPVSDAYRELHRLPVSAPDGVRFYSAAWGRAYEVTTESAAAAILAAVQQTLDFPRLVEKAYADGVRLFVEIGPGASCTRMIGAILGRQPHLARAVCVPRRHDFSQLLRTLAQLRVEGVPIDLSCLYADAAPLERSPSKQITLPTAPLWQPLPDRKQATIDPNRAKHSHFYANDRVVDRRIPQPQNGRSKVLHETVPMLLPPVEPATVWMESQEAILEAHHAYLRFSTQGMNAFREVLAFQTALLALAEHPRKRADSASPKTKPAVKAAGHALPEPSTEPIPTRLDFARCLEFARGKVGNVLGAAFAEIDTFPTRVRLPDGPLMLVDRVLAIEGTPRSLRSGRVVTEHWVHGARWYLDNGRIPTSVAVEAGQADLFLSSYLGIDFQTRGLAVYRLLDAVVTFHQSLPPIDAVIVYDIRIDRFFQQGNAWFFHFHFDASVEGKLFLSMRDGCAGFFTAEDLAAGQGIKLSVLDQKLRPGKLPENWSFRVPLESGSLTEPQVDALRKGDLVGAFGSAFAGLPLTMPLRLPGGMARLVHRIPVLEPYGGRYGLGRVIGEADIHPDDWFLTCHFVDDMVMPGTLMYECCLHTFRIFLMRLGWVGEETEIHCEPMVDVASRLKCRGQVLPTTRIVRYEVVVKALGDDPDLHALADAYMYADGKRIVEITDLSLRFHGLTRQRLEQIWSGRAVPTLQQATRQFDRDKILAFAVGNPSEAFGEPYRIFDSERVIARLPGPPYQFLDRIVRIEAQPWVMQAGGVIEAEYEVPSDAWYFEANRQETIPFAVLLEIALQPCGWFAAYLGSALTSAVDLSFRNLGGSATQYRELGRATGTLTTQVKITQVSHSGGMIIQHYDFSMRAGLTEVYTGKTYFGFFSKQALAQQVGMKEHRWPEPASPWGEGRRYPNEGPFPDERWRMVQTIETYHPQGGRYAQGLVEGSIRVNPEAWFFQAHFYQDPVWPGSLGLESLLQLLKWVAAHHWGVSTATIWQTPALAQEHRWTYRGQILPSDRQVEVIAEIKQRDDHRKRLLADGLLRVDGRIIYEMTDFSLSQGAET